MRPVVLSVAGLDPGGGAGIVADVKTIEAHDCWAAAVVATQTVQRVARVTRVVPTPSDLVEAQIEAVFDDHIVAAVKIGLLADPSTIGAVAAGLRDRDVPIVLDPVLGATSGACFLDDEAVARMRDELLPLAFVVTPNQAEAARLAGVEVAADPSVLATRLRDFGARHVLITGGTTKGRWCEDRLYSGGDVHLIRHRAIDSDRTHGTGCAHSSSLAARLAHGHSLRTAAVGAADWIEHAIEHGQPFGGGGAPDTSWRPVATGEFTT